MPMDTSALQEAFRRRANLGPPSSAGIPGGAPAANAPSAQNPLARLAPQGLSPQGPSMSAPGMAQLGKSQPGEAELIIKALTQRLKTLAPGQ